MCDWNKKGTQQTEGYIDYTTVPHDRRPDEAFLADRGYDADAIRDEIEGGVEAVILPKSNHQAPGPSQPGEIPLVQSDRALFNKLKNWRRVATRYDKTKESYLGFVASALIKLRMPFVHVA